MALGRQGAVRRELLIGWHEVPVAPGHVFYDRLSEVLDAAGFDRGVEALCATHYACDRSRRRELARSGKFERRSRERFNRSG